MVNAKLKGKIEDYVRNKLSLNLIERLCNEITNQQEKVERAYAR